MSDADLKSAAPAPAADLGEQHESADLFGGMKKKKKDKKKLDLDLDLDLDEDDPKDSVDADAEKSNAPAAENDELNVSAIRFAIHAVAQPQVHLHVFPSSVFAVRRVEEEEKVQKEGSARP